MLWDIATRLARAGIEVHVICSRQLYENPRAKLAARDRVAGVHIHRVSTLRFGRGHLIGRALDYASFYLTASGAMLRIVRDGDVLVVKTDPPLLSIFGAVVAALRNATLVNWLQDVFPEIASQLNVARLPKAFERVLQAARDRSMRRASMNIVLGRRMFEYFVARGIDERRLCIVENWADGQAILPKPVRQSALRAQLDLADRFVIEYSGNLGRAHELETLLDAAERLRDDAEIVFLMIGGGVNMSRLQALVRDRALASFRFLPYQARDCLADSLAAGDVHLVNLRPSLEGFIVPSKAYGILAAGRPAIFIGDQEGEIARVLRDAECGFTVECGDGAALANAIHTLRADAGLRESMGLRARDVFDRRFTLDIAEAKWLGRVLSPEYISPASALRPRQTQ